MKKAISRIRLLLILFVLCGAAVLAFKPARADGLCHYWSYDGCISNCDRQEQICSRNHWANCDTDHTTCTDDCDTTCQDGFPEI
ncbi:MAG: hypothetical protein JOZ52_05945 [Acidobacteria bacterium]|nr:hypothetical protein [Acidobacteriota bacterium]